VIRGRRPAIHFVRHGESVANVADCARRDRPDDGDRLSERGWVRPDRQHRHATLAWMPDADPTYAEPGAESFADVVARVRRVQHRLHSDAGHRRIVAVSHFGFLHWFLGVTLFGDGFVPGHLPALYRMGHANTGITVFERHDRRVMDGLDLSGWVLTTWNDQAHL